MFGIARALLTGALALGFVSLVSRSAEACSVCLAGDPVFSAQGTTAQQQGDVSVFLEGRGWVKRSGTLPHDHEDEEEEDHEAEERSEGRRIDLYLSWTPLDRVTLTLDIPFAFNTITEIDEEGRETSSLSGLSDVALQTSVVVWRNRDVLPDTWVEGRAFLKTPTGESREAVDGVKDPHLQPGTGSWDFGFGLAGVHRLTWGSLYSSAVYRVNTPGSLHYEYGDALLANAAVEVPLGHALGRSFLAPFTPGFELNFRWADVDRSRGESYADSGGSILYLTPSLRVELPTPWEGRVRSALRAAVQIPATSAWLNGFQREDPIWYAGLQLGF